MKQKIAYIVFFIAFASLITYLLLYQKPKELKSLDINLASTSITLNDKTFLIGEDAGPILEFINKNFNYYNKDSGWVDYIDSAGVCPSDEVRVITYGDLDLIFMKQGSKSLFTAWSLSRKSNPTLPGSTTVDSFIKLGIDIKALEEHYKNKLDVTNDDIHGTVFSIIDTDAYPEYFSEEIDLPSAAPITGNFNRSLTVEKVESGFLCAT
jgi:hypothetical protein